MTTTFTQARAVVERETGKKTAEYGWENDTEFLIALDGDPGFDEPDRLVHKDTGQMREVVGSLGADPVSGLRPIGDVPE